MRQPIIAGNWKMNKTSSEGVELVAELLNLVEEIDDVDIVVCPPFTALKDVSGMIAEGGSKIGLGAQNMFWEKEGAFTGEISPTMLKEFGVDYVIIGHSERRKYFAETNEDTNKKVRKSLDFDFSPILCVGESLEEREKSETETVVRLQVLEGLANLSREEVEKVVIAYEPLWAIGTGRAATPELANDVIRYIRAAVGSQFTPDAAKKIRIQYGGSVTPENIGEFMEEPDIDGALVGGASLNAKTFAELVRKAVKS